MMSVSVMMHEQARASEAIQHPPFVPRAQARVYRNITPNLAVWAIAR